MARRFYRVVESPGFLERLETAPPSFVAVLLEFVYPVLSAAPDEATGPFPITYDPPFYSIELHTEGGDWGIVLYEVLEDERLVMLYDYLWATFDER